MRFFVPVTFLACTALLSITSAEARQANRPQNINQPSAAERVLWDRADGHSPSASTAPAAQSRQARRNRHSSFAASARSSRRFHRNAMPSADVTGSISASRTSFKAAPGSDSLRAKVQHYAAQNGVPGDVAHGVVMVESRYNPRASGPGGYIGLMQLSYRTAQGMGYRGSRAGLYDPDTNLQYGMKYLAGAWRQSGGSMCGAISKYQGGHGVRGVTRAGAVYCSKVRQHMANKKRTDGVKLASN
jgi:soluble lytic murein transglycosylase-like protein